VGGPSRHTPVLVREVCDAFEGVLPGSDATPAGVFVDATCGLGGHTLAVLARFRPAAAIAMDRDPAALEEAGLRLADSVPPVQRVRGRFSTLAVVLPELGVSRVTALVADLGVSSLQLDTPARGFSFRAAAPLDMRMDPEEGESAADFLARVDAASLGRILREYGEEPDARRIATAIVQARPRTTKELADVVAASMSHRQRRKLGTRLHPATRTFQAIRIHVNAELEELDRFLADAPSRLTTGGRLAIITFHSLEDRRVKQRFARLCRPVAPPASVPVRAADLPPADFRIPPGYARGVTPTDAEIEANPRARSARLRVIERALDAA
jgi:16S rRNA (cytosine1402-N4)-methyltransferase